MTLAIHAAVAVHPVGAIAVFVETIEKLAAGTARRPRGAAGKHGEDDTEQDEAQF
jgi:hypothetical protein